MNYRCFAWKYTFYFFLFGQSPYYSRSISHEISPKKRMLARSPQLATYIPSILFLFYIIVVILYFFDSNINRQQSFSINLYFIFRMILFINCIVTMKCSPLFPNTLTKIWTTFESLEYYANQTLHLQWSFKYKYCNRQILKKFSIITMLFASHIGYKVVLREGYPIYAVIVNYSIIAISFMSMMHALLYIETLHFMMKTINESLSKPIRKINGAAAVVFKLQDNYEDRMYANIDVYKNIYYKFWQISKLINDNFGSIFVCFFMQVMINIWNVVTRFIIDIQKYEELLYEAKSTYFIKFVCVF